MIVIVCGLVCDMPSWNGEEASGGRKCLMLMDDAVILIRLSGGGRFVGVVIDCVWIGV